MLVALQLPEAEGQKAFYCSHAANKKLVKEGTITFKASLFVFTSGCRTAGWYGVLNANVRCAVGEGHALSTRSGQGDRQERQSTLEALGTTTPGTPSSEAGGLGFM